MKGRVYSKMELVFNVLIIKEHNIRVMVVHPVDLTNVLIDRRQPQMENVKIVPILRSLLMT